MSCVQLGADGRMKKVSELNWNADKFRMMAKRATSPEQKTMLSKMAEMWENLAKEREAESVVRQIGELEGSKAASPVVSPSDKTGS
jgi:hypothetical protein